MTDYDVNTVEMSYRFVVFMVLTATLSASMKLATSIVPEGSVLTSTDETHKDTNKETIEQMVFVALLLQVAYAVIALCNVLIGTNAAFRRMRDTFYATLAFPAAVLFCVASLSKNIDIEMKDADSKPLTSMLVAQRDYIIFLTVLVEMWFFDRRFYSLFDDVTRIAIIASVGAGVTIVRQACPATCAMELYGALFLIFTFLAIVFRGICQLETEPAEITHEEEAIASAAASPRTPRRSRETTTVLSDSEDEVTFSTKKRSTKKTATRRVSTKSGASSQTSSAKKSTPRRGKKESLLSDDEADLTEADIPKQLRIDHPGPKAPVSIAKSRLRERRSSSRTSTK